MNFSILTITTIFVLFISFLLALFLLTVKTSNKIANTFLGVYFLIFAIHISAFFYSKYITLPPVVEMLRDHIAFFTSPLLFLYVISSIYSDFKLKPRHLLHILPFAIQILIFSPRFYFANNYTKSFVLENLNDTLEGKLSIIFGLSVSLFYLTAMFLELRKYKQVLMENYANKSVFNFKWLYQLFILLSIIFCFSLFKQVYKLFGTDVEVLNTSRLILTLTLIGFLTWIVLKSMYNPKLFRNINSNHLLIKNDINQKHLNKNIKEEIQKLLVFMEDEEPFLDPSFTLQKLAEKLEMPSRDISILINLNLNQHFFDFVNHYRIKKAERMLVNAKEENLTIQQIMYDVGFNSKSSFYAAFKKQIGMTPSEYKKRRKIS
ncbi:helix-turn-helix domain-containing protein [Flavobacteriaceae bacterium R38]|nr:helix-turn-helix domain-containing protein [Flavobacteriaceae bacterium R38]